MKRALMVAAGIAMLFALAGRAAAQTQVTSTGVNYGSWTVVKWTQLDQERGVGLQELMGIRVDDTGRGPFHNIPTHLSMVVYVDKTGVKFDGYETHTDKDGDKVIWSITGGVVKGVNKGTARIVGATGKFDGMQGTMDFVTQDVKGFPEGTGRTLCRENMKLTLQKPLS